MLWTNVSRIIWFYLFNGISTPNGLIICDIWFFYKYFIVIISAYIFNVPKQSLFFYYALDLSRIICLGKVISFQVFLSNTNNSCSYIVSSNYSYLIKTICLLTVIYLPNPSTQVKCDTRSIFKAKFNRFEFRPVTIPRLKNPVFPTIYP